MKNSRVPRISETEWEVMQAVWQGHPCAAQEVVARLAEKDASWHPKTAKTLLARLVRKGALAYRQEGRAYVYHPLVSEAECQAQASESFVERVFGGSLKPMLAHFVERRKLSAAELRELRRLLEERED
jgi:BlaI family transcriptional regulator, penicillinase repressor